MQSGLLTSPHYIVEILLTLIRDDYSSDFYCYFECLAFQCRAEVMVFCNVLKIISMIELKKSLESNRRSYWTIVQPPTSWSSFQNTGFLFAGQ